MKLFGLPRGGFPRRGAHYKSTSLTKPCKGFVMREKWRDTVMCLAITLRFEPYNERRKFNKACC